MVSFISVNYNGLELTKKMISSIITNVRSCDFEIIVVDNGSATNEAEVLQKEFPQIISIRSEQNLGFAGGNNLALDKANGDLLFLSITIRRSSKTTSTSCAK